MKNNVLVLTTREKDWWWSMQEIFPAIERVWTSIGRRERENVRVMCVPLLPEIEQEMEADAPMLKLIVLVAVTPGTVEIALRLRSKFRVDAPMIVYVHGDSTEGFHAFGKLVEFLTDRDIFVTASESEAAATRLCFSNARVCVIPFPLASQFKLNSGERDTLLRTMRLAYVGRIAEQKNLHTLLFAIWLLRYERHQPLVTLDVFGGESNPGSPMMGLEFQDYSAYLRELTELLGLTDVVTWHGIMPRDWLFYNVHMEPFIFVHPTLLSDENFGSSVLASLTNGHKVVSTAWGGPRDWLEWFPEQLILVPVRRSTRGPVVDPYALTNALLEANDGTATKIAANTSLERARAKFSEDLAVTRTYQLIDGLEGPSEPLKKSPLLDQIDKQRVIFGGARKIYADYDDPAARAFFEAYGMDQDLVFEEGRSYILAPWVIFSGQELSVVDPHRGEWNFLVELDAVNTVEVIAFPHMKVHLLPGSLVEILVMQGYAFPIPSETD